MHEKSSTSISGHWLELDDEVVERDTLMSVTIRVSCDKRPELDKYGHEAHCSEACKSSFSNPLLVRRVLSAEEGGRRGYLT